MIIVKKNTKQIENRYKCIISIIFDLKEKTKNEFES